LLKPADGYRLILPEHFIPDIAVEGKIGLQKKRKANKNAPFR